jgi:hypothetical protein
MTLGFKEEQVSNKVTVTVVDTVTKNTLYEFKLDPTKATYVVPEGSKFGFVFEPEKEQTQCK